MSDIPALPWTIDPGFDSLIASTDEDTDGACSILSADGETIVAQRLMREHAELIIAAVHAYYDSSNDGSHGLASIGTLLQPLVCTTCATHLLRHSRRLDNVANALARSAAFSSSRLRSSGSLKSL